MKKAQIPEGKIDTLFVLPVMSTIKIGNEEYGKLEYFVGYKVCNVKMDNTNYVKDFTVLTKILTGDKKGEINKSRQFRRHSYDSFRNIKVNGNILTFDLKKKDGVYYLDDYLGIYNLNNEKQLEKIFEEFPDRATCKELQDIVETQNDELVDMIIDAKERAQEKQEKTSKLAAENDKIFN